MPVKKKAKRPKDRVFTPVLTDQPTLTMREVQTAIHIAGGLTYNEIGDKLNIGYETVRAYAENLRKKTGRPRKSQLAVWAAQQSSWLLQEQARLTDESNA